MKKEHIVYGGYMLFFAILVGVIFAVPIMAFNQDMEWAYDALAFTCHQKLSRSLCIYNSGAWIRDCTNQSGTYVNSIIDRTTVRVQDGLTAGYKIPVCSRDVGLYGAMLLGGAAYPFFRRINEKKMYPAIFLVLAIVPLGIDGTVQLISELGLLPFVYESTNLIRLVTGAIAGFGAAVYAIPVLMNMFDGGPSRTPKKDNKKVEQPPED